MRKLIDILNGVEIIEVKGKLEIEISQISFDSRDINNNSLFIATIGTMVDGHRFINSAIDKGACAIVCQTLPENIDDNITYIIVNNSQIALAIIASNYYNNPSQSLNIIGITGTNGKTTIATLLYQLFRKLGYKVGLVSTIRYLVNETEYKATHTTPDAISLNKLFNQMVEEGCEFCFMEVSSHAIAQNRTAGISFKGAVFTNITHDHLDYHPTFIEYINAKKQLFDNLDRDAFTVVNKDDKNGSVILQNSNAGKYFYSIKSVADYQAKILESHFDGMLLTINGEEVWSPFIGDFNVYNILAVYGVALQLNQDKHEVLTKISSLTSVDGRFECLKSKEGKIAIVDYAHTPDALKNVLNTINNIRQGNETVITVVGAGGNRDKSKRPEMGRIASQMSDRVIFTSDNPRNEDPAQIIDEIKEGVEIPNKKKVLSIIDRKEAIRTAIMMAGEGDIVLVAGKGHETYQEINGVRADFDDKKVIQEIFNDL